MVDVDGYMEKSSPVPEFVLKQLSISRSRVTVGEWVAIWLGSRSDLRRSTCDCAEGAIRNHIVP